MAQPTMKDVARVAGVSLKTVSRYVNGETNIDPALAERIREAIASLNYRRNLMAASIRPGRTSKTIGLVIGDLANPYYSTLARAIENVLSPHGYLLTTASSEEDGIIHDRLVDRLMEQRVDGMIVVPPRRQERSWSDVAPPIPPLVLIDRPAPDIDVDTILADNRGGSDAATRELIKMGARRIAFVGDSLAIYTMRERLHGYRGALLKAALTPADSLEHESAHDAEQAAALVAEILRKDTADAIFAANNRGAVGALRAFRTCGRRLPLIAFDDFEAADIVEPQVSVVSHDIRLMGRRAGEMLLDRLQGQQRQAQTIVLPTRMVLRGSELMPPSLARRAHGV